MFKLKRNMNPVTNSKNSVLKRYLQIVPLHFCCQKTTAFWLVGVKNQIKLFTKNKIFEKVNNKVITATTHFMSKCVPGICMGLNF